MRKIKIDLQRVPTHIAIIMDGNRRWAVKHNLGPVDGHKQAVDFAIEPLIKEAIKLKVKYLTFWAWSTENWQRDKKEVLGVMKLFKNSLYKNCQKFLKMGIQLRCLGDISRFSRIIRDRLLYFINLSRKNKKIIVTFALNYGGRDEIIRAVKKIIQSGKKADQINESVFSQSLDSADIPDPDLIIRTGGAQRMSGFLPWQSVYSEFYFTPILMPEFSPQELRKAIADFQSRDRRFGGGKFGDYVTRKS